MGKGKGRTVGLTLFLVSLTFAVLPSCGSSDETSEGELCAQTACENGDCATHGSQMVRHELHPRCAKPKKAIDAGAPVAAPLPQEDAVFPCAICARADNCCRAQAGASCGYRSACSSAHSSDEMAYYSAICRLYVESGTAPGSGGCGAGISP